MKAAVWGLVIMTTIVVAITGMVASAVSVTAAVVDQPATTPTGDGQPVAPIGLPTSGGSPTGPITEAEVVWVRGFAVHHSIATNVAALVDAAAGDGVVFGGWGWRSHQRQIDLRRAHCGTSHYAIWDMPSGRCNPPTARPGRSQHEYGLAIDFTCNGARIAGTYCFRWLKTYAHRYGFYNLPSEPWHWSTTGN